MSVKWKVSNPDLSGEELTYLSSDYASGVTLTVKNNDNFTANYFAVAGEPGQEQTESSQIASITNKDTITLSAAYNFSHPKSTPIYESQWDKISMVRSTSATGTFTEITGSPFSIEWDNKDLVTNILDSSGSSSYYYKWRFYNSVTGTYSEYSGVISGAGLSRDQVGYLIKQVRNNPLAKEVDDETIMEFFNDLHDVVYEKVPNAWWNIKEGTEVATAASTYQYAISGNWNDFLAMQYLLFRYVNGDTDVTYPLTWSPLAEFYNLKSDSDQATDDYAKYWTLLPPDSDSALGYIGIHPTPKTDDCYLKPVYSFEMEDIDSFTDTVVVPKPKIYVDYALYRIADDIKMDAENANKYLASFNTDIISLKSRERRQRGQPEFNRFRGQRGWSRMFGEQGRLNSPDAKELYW